MHSQKCSQKMQLEKRRTSLNLRWVLPGAGRRDSEQTLLLLGRSLHLLRDTTDCICQVSCGVFKASRQFVNLLSLNKGLYIEPRKIRSYVAIPGRAQSAATSFRGGTCLLPSHLEALSPHASRESSQSCTIGTRVLLPKENKMFPVLNTLEGGRLY